MIDFTHLHLHTEFSLLDGMSSPEEVALRVRGNQQTACAITDHGSMAGTLRFQKACVQHGVKPIFGVEAYYVPSLDTDDLDKRAERFHLILLARTQEGLFKLFRLQQESWTKGFYYKPRVEHADLEYLHGDIIVLSGCMAGLLARYLERGQESEAEQLVGQFRQDFNQDYYLELQPWNFDGLNNRLLDLGDAFGIQCVGTIDCHYPTESDKGIEEVLLGVGQYPSFNATQNRFANENAVRGHAIHDLVAKMDCLWPDRRLRFADHGLYIMDGQEVADAFREVGIKEDIFTATMEIADKCNAVIPVGRKLLPKFSKLLDSNQYLSEIAHFALEEQGLSFPEYTERLEEELSVVLGLDFADYFLVIWDICQWADRNGVARGHSRGSVGGSLLAYLLGITAIDPIKHGLLFGRFINAERNDYPDVDLDFEDRRRGEVKNYVRERWGTDNTASISTYNVFKAKVLQNIS